MAANLSPIASEAPTEGEASGHGPATPPALVPRADGAPPRTYRSLSLVIPSYNEAESLRALHRELCEHIGAIGVPFEILLIDDGSSDDTAAIARELHEADERVRYVRFRRNFGKAAALSEGFKRATGDVVITMDADLQDNPAEVIRLLDALDQGYDLCSGWKWPRLDPIGKRWPSKVFNWAVRKGSGVQLHDVNCGLKAYRRELLQAVSVYGDMHRFIPVLADAAGFKVTEVKVSHRPRQFGHSKYSVGRFSRGLLDFMTVLFLTRYRTRPLHVIGGVALTMGLLGAGVLFYLTLAWIGGTPIQGRPLFFLGILLSIVSIQLLTFGLLAEMVTSFFLEKQNDYPIREALGFEEDSR
jgi:glycosyltransferase involved in cell wall biosynthesis